MGHRIADVEAVVELGEPEVAGLLGVRTRVPLLVVVAVRTDVDAPFSIVHLLGQRLHRIAADRRLKDAATGVTGRLRHPVVRLEVDGHLLVAGVVVHLHVERVVTGTDAPL